MGWAFYIDPGDTLGVEPDYLLDQATNQVVQVGTYFDNQTKEYTSVETSILPALILAIGTPKGSFPDEPEYGSEIEHILQTEGDRTVLPGLLRQAIESALQLLVNAGVITIREISVRIEEYLAVAEISVFEHANPFTLTLGAVS